MKKVLLSFLLFMNVIESHLKYENIRKDWRLIINSVYKSCAYIYVKWYKFKHVYDN